ncbi:MAG: hypothetical protein L3J35_00810 [Bacteroidales bacterium]|nr:hypothetical protein [Bacteroidales bacterium]
MKKFITTLILFFTIFTAVAQDYSWKAEIGDVKKAGYYKIFLSPDITSQLNHSFPDIRVLDSEKSEIQYILKKEKTVFDRKKRTELKILKNKYKKYKHYTEVQIENKGKENISNLTFKIVNTHNPIFLKLYGSEDLNTWFVIKDNFPAVPEITHADSTEIKIMDLPESQFNYYKILFYDYDDKPIELSNIYFHDLTNIRAEYIQLNSPKITQKDTLNKSIITLEFQKPEFIDMISFGIKGPEFYLRKVFMSKKDTSSVPYSGEDFYDQFNKEFYIGSLKSNRVLLWDYKAKKIEFIVDNKDNQPLTFYKANSYQLKNYLITYLSPDEEYSIIYGSKTANFPSYDLPYFKDTIPDILPETPVYNIKKIPGTANEINTIWDFPVQYLWYSIGFIGIVLLLISLKLLREKFGKTKKTE